MTREIPRYRHCFVCGPENDSGLNLQFFTDGKVTKTRYTPDSRHEGYKGFLHGGIIATVLDEVMIKAALAQDIRCVTAWMEVKFRAPIAINSELLFEGEIVEIKGRIIKTIGRAVDASEKICAEASGKYMRVSEEFEKKLMESLGE